MSFWADLHNTSFRLSWIDVAGVRTRYVEAGRGPRTVVFLHGVAGHLEMFLHNIAAHALTHRVLVFDLLGHGYTEKPEHDYEINDYLRHVLAFLDAKEVVRASIAGTSLGGWVAARLAAAYPERVETLSLISTAGLTAHPGVMAKLKTLSTDAASSGSGRDAVRARLGFVIKNKALITDELVDTRWRIYSRPEYQRAIPHIMCLQRMEVRQRNLLTIEELGRIKARTLVAWTKNDPTGTLEDGEKYAEGIPDSEFVVFNESSHMPQYEEPDLFNKLHMRFLDGVKR